MGVARDDERDGSTRGSGERSRAALVSRINRWVKRASRPGPVGRTVATLLLLGLAAISPPGTFLRTHVASQIGEVARIARLHPTREEVRQSVLGTDYRFLAFVKKMTEPDDVILMSDQFAFSELEPLKAKSQRWATFFLYPRRVLYLHQEEIPFYREAEWLILDGPAAVDWIDPSVRPEYQPGELRLSAFEMGRYLELVAAGELDRRWLPPPEPSRAPKSGS